MDALLGVSVDTVLLKVLPMGIDDLFQRHVGGHSRIPDGLKLHVLSGVASL